MKHGKRKKAHHFVCGESLCGVTASYQGPYWKDIDDDLGRVYCTMKLDKRRDEA